MPELIPVESGSPEWLAARRAGVTATDIVTILGLSRWDSAYSLFWRKMGQVPEVEDNDRFRLGRVLEEYVWCRWLESREEWAGWAEYRKPALFRHDARWWQMATPDRVYPEFTLELKSWAEADRHAWGLGTVYDEDGTLLVRDAQVPPAVRAQVLWQMDVMDVSTGHVGVVFLPSGRFESYTISHGPHGNLPGIGVMPVDLLACDVCKDLDLMRAAGEEFMGRLRLELPPPDPDASAATMAAVRARFVRQPAKQAEVDEATFGHWRDAKEEADAWAREVRGWEIRLREQAGEAAELCVDGQLVARRVISDAKVKAHTRHQDYLKRVKQGDDSEG